MKRNKVIALLMIITLSISIIPIINAEELVFDAEYGFSIGISSPPWNTITFYSNYTKLFYVFFEYDRPLVGSTTFYSTSFDGVNWSNATRLFYPDSGSAWSFNKGRWDFYLEPNGKYLHGALVLTTPSPNSINYFKRELFLNGSWGVLDDGPDVPQLIFNEDLGAYGEANQYLDLYLDNESYPFITFTSYDPGGWETGFLIEGDYPIPLNGTWGHGDYNLVEWQNEFSNQWDNDWKCTVTGLSDESTETGFGRGVHWMNTHEASLGSGQERSQDAHNYYNGSGWINLGDGGASALWDHEGGDWADNCWDIVAIGNITLYVKQTEAYVTPERIRLSYGTRIGGQDWEVTDRAVSSFYLGDAGAVQIAPKIGVDYNRNVVIVWTIHHPDNSSVWYRLGNIGFDGIMTWYTNETLWEDWQQWGVWLFDSYGSGMAEPLPSNVPLSMSYEDTTDESIYHDYLFPLEGEELDIPYSYDNTTLEGDGWILDDDWIFMGEKYLFISYVSGATTFELSFDDGYDTHTIKMNFDNDTEKLSTSNDENDEFTTGLYFSNYTLLSDNVTQEIIWGWIPEKNIVDDINVSVSYTLYNEEFDVTLAGDTGITFNLYNLGGLVAYDFNGGGRSIGGEPFELWADDGNGNYSYAETIFRKLQHVHFLFELDYDPTWYSNHWDDFSGGGWVTFGIDYRINSTWIEGWECQLYIQESQVGHFGVSQDASFIKLNVEWYNQGVKIKENDLYAYSYGYYPIGGNESDRTTFNCWVDLWFNKMNSSSVIAGRVNAYQYGMRQEGWWMWSSVAPVIGNVTSSMFFDDLLDGDGNVTTVRNIELIKFRTTINRTGSFDSRWTLVPYQVFNYKVADDRMEGVDTPVFVETTVIDMPKTGFVAPIVKAIQGISTAISKAMFNMVKLLIGALDTFLVDILHSPVSMSQMIEWIMIQGTYVTQYLSTVLLYVSSMLEVFSQMIEFITSIVTYFVNLIIWVLVNVVPFPLHIIRFIIAILNGNTYTIGGMTWDLTSGSELIQGALTIGSLTIGYMFVLWVIWGNMYGEGALDLEGLPKRIIMIFQYLRETFQSVFWIFNRMRNEVISLYNFIRSHIPQIGGGGGETAE